MSAESLPLRRSLAWPAAYSASGAVHALVAAWLLAAAAQQLPPDVIDLSRAVPVAIVPLPRPEPPRPEPPEPRPQTDNPTPVPVPELVESVSESSMAETPPPEPEPAVEQTPAPAAASVAGVPDYLSRLRGLIEQAKRYPRDAVLAGEQGTVLLWFIVNREGTILAFRIEQSSRSRALDGEVRRMLKRIGRFPAIPAEEFGARDRLELTIPIDFKLVD